VTSARAAPGSFPLRNRERCKPHCIRSELSTASGSDWHALEGQSAGWTVTQEKSRQVLLRTGCETRSRARTTMPREERWRSPRHRSLQESTPAMVTRLALSLSRPWGPERISLWVVQDELSLCLCHMSSPWRRNTGAPILELPAWGTSLLASAGVVLTPPPPTPSAAQPHEGKHMHKYVVHSGQYTGQSSEGMRQGKGSYKVRTPPLFSLHAPAGQARASTFSRGAHRLAQTLSVWRTTTPQKCFVVPRRARI